MIRETLERTIEGAKKDLAYINYLEVRDRVLDIMDSMPLDADPVSDYWKAEIEGFDYMLDASPLVVRKLREHCYHLTGLRAYDYRDHHEHKARPFAAKLASLRQLDRSGLLVAESPLVGGFGHEIDGKLINVDTLKFYECLMALDLAGILPQLRGDAGAGKAVIEIGAGWGGFAYQFKTLCPKVTYIIVDLPQALLYSGTYLKTVFPEASVRLVTELPRGESPRLAENDFLLVPHFLFGELQLPALDLAVNMVSFQEMTTRQVRGYVESVRLAGCERIYSLNRDRSPHNEQLTAVSSIVGEFYSVREIPVLEAPYTQLGSARPRRQAPRAKRPAHEYRHLVGENLSSVLS